MSTIPAIDWTQHGTTTPSRYRFVLSFVLYSENGTLELVNAPLEWKNIELQLKRDQETHGVYLSAVINTLTFIKEGKQLLEDLYAEKGVFSTCHLYIYYLDFDTREYLSMPSRYRLDFNSRRLVNLTRTTNGVQIDCVADDMVSKFQQRKNTIVDLRNLKGLSGFPITDYTDLKKHLVIPEISTYQSARFDNSEVNSYALTIGEAAEYITLPYTVTFSDFGTETVNKAYQVNSVLNHMTGIFGNATVEREIIVKGTINIDIIAIAGLDALLSFYLKVLDTSDNEISSVFIFSYNYAESGPQALTIDKTITVPIGDYLLLLVEAYIPAGAGQEVTVDFGVSDIQLFEVLDTTSASVVETYPIYEAIERNLQIILDTQFPLYSEFFGRTDTPYNLTPDYYASENQLRFANILSGLNIRGMHHTDDNNPHPVRFMDLFKALKAIWCVGGGFEMIGTELRFRIEDLAYFYQNTETLDLSARINESEIEREQYSDLMFAKIKTGYSKFDYEAILGRGEYNTTQDRTTVVPNDNELNLICPLRADTRGILECMQKAIESTGTEDTKGDADLFVIKTQRGAIQDWDAETTENVVVENNTSLFLTGSLNLYLTPLRNLIRNGRIANTGLALKPGTEIAYQTSDKNATLKTTGEGITITENQNVTTESLATPLWYPELLIVTLPFYEVDYKFLADSPLGYITLSENLSGWVMDVNWKFAQNSATLKLLRRIPV